MLTLLLLAGPLAATGALLLVRRRDPVAPTPRVDRVLAVALVAVSVLLVTAWPSTTVRAWLGYVSPDQCLGKNKPPPPRQGPPAGIEALKADLRLQRLDPGPPSSVEVTETVQLDHVTGPGSSGRTLARWGVGGTDLGHPFLLDGRLGLVFGDTFAVPEPSGPFWRSNVLGWVEDIESDRLEITSMVESPTGGARELLGSLKINGWEQTVIPTNTTVVDGEVILHYMSVACWGRHGRWAVRHSGLAVSRDGGTTFERVRDARFPPDTGFAQAAFVHGQDGWLYVFGIPEGRDGPARLARVRTDRVLDRTAWRFWNGDDWSTDLHEAEQVVAPPVGELSVAWSPYLDRWLMMYLDELRGGIVVRTASELTGPWSRARLAVSALEVPTLYAPFLLPGSLDGPEIRYTMSRFDIYNVVLMRSRLELIPDARRG